MRDIYLDASLEEIVAEISDLSDTVITAIYELVFKNAGQEKLPARTSPLLPWVSWVAES